MATTLFIEILNDRELRLYDGQNTDLLTDSDLMGKLRQYPKNASIVLIDALHIQSKIFTRPVQDKKILSQVIAADMSDYLLQGSEAYQFAHQAEQGTTWVSWIEKSRLAALKSRFSQCASQIKALVSMPLLIACGQQQLHNDEVAMIAENTPLTYAIRGGQTTVMRSEQASAWMASFQDDMPALIELTTLLHTVFREEHLKSLPNLWQKQRSASDTANAPLLLWAGLATLAVLLWVANSYMAYRRAAAFNDSALEAQQVILKQVFPNAKGADPYGRLSADYQRLNNNETTDVLTKLDEILAPNALELSGLSIDMTAKHIELQGNIDDALQKQFGDKGFTVSPLDAKLNAKGVRLSW